MRHKVTFGMLIANLPFLKDILGTSKYSARGELREIFSSDDTKIRVNTLCIAEDFCEI